MIWFWALKTILLLSTNNTGKKIEEPCRLHDKNMEGPCRLHGNMEGLCRIHGKNMEGPWETWKDSVYYPERMQEPRHNIHFTG